MPEGSLSIILFVTIHEVLKAEKAFKRGGIEAEVVPVPRAISSDCGVCIKTACPEDMITAVLGPVKGMRLFSYDGQAYRAINRD